MPAEAGIHEVIKKTGFPFPDRVGDKFRIEGMTMVEVNPLAACY